MELVEAMMEPVEVLVELVEAMKEPLEVLWNSWMQRQLHTRRYRRLAVRPRMQRLLQNRCDSNRSRKPARTCLLFRVIVEQADAKTIANTKVRQFGSTSQVAKIVDNCY